MQGVAWSLEFLADLATDQGQHAKSQTSNEEALAIRRLLDDRFGICSSLGSLGHTCLHIGDFVRAREYLEESLQLQQELGNNLTARELSDLGEVARAEGDDANARSLLEQSLAAAVAGGDARIRITSLVRLGNIAAAQSDFAQSASRHHDALAHAREDRDPVCLAECLEGRARAARDEGNFHRSVVLLGAAQSRRDPAGTPVPPYRRSEYDDDVQTLRIALGDDAYNVAWSEGRAMSADDAIEYALRESQA
jgi:tetratricopeptide (TPR) repeat protein